MDEEKNISLLPQKCVDTGAGLERFAMILQNKDSIHEIDQYEKPFLLIKKSVNDIKWTRVIFDHLKTSLLIMSAGIKPGSQKEGYLLKRLIRRSLTGLYLKNIDLEKSKEFLWSIAEAVENKELSFSMKNNIDYYFDAEVFSFSKMLSRNRKYLDKVIAENKISGDYAFQLKTTYGVPEELIRELCNQYLIDFPENDFLEKIKIHQEKSKK